MKVNTPVDLATIGSAKGSSQFSIKASAKAFSILSSGLYSNKIRAIIRELSCNAFDAHILNGNPDEPFTVKLPNSIDPTFYVRDYGIGLSHDDVVNLYTTYFESTKQESNDFVGALGLGSKSPFSYTQNFSVISIKDGWKGIYTAYLNDEGCPAIALMDEMNTEERNGLEVRLSVTSERDIWKFAEEAAIVFKWFKTVPTITGNSYFRVNEVKYREMDIVEGVHIRDESYGTAVAIQGNVAYPIDISSTIDFDKLSYLLKQPLVIEFNIGDLDVAASREKLSFDTNTIKNIKKRLQEIDDNLLKYCKNKISGIKNQWELREALIDMYRSSLLKNSVLQLVSDGACKLLTLSGCQLRPSDVFVLKKDWLQKNGMSIIKLRRGPNNLTFFEQPEIKLSGPGVDGNDPVGVEIPDEEKTVFILNDKKTGPRARVRHHFKGMQGSAINCIIISSEDSSIGLEAAMKKIKRKLHNPPKVEVYKIDELTKKERKLKNISMGLMKLTGTFDNKWSSVRTFDEDENETYYYIALSNYDVLDKNGKKLRWDFLRHWNNIRKVKFVDHNTTVYGVRKSYIKLIEGRKNWINILDVIEERMRNLDTTELIKAYINNVMNRKMVYRNLLSFSDYLKYDDSLMKSFIEKYRGNIKAINYGMDNFKIYHTLYSKLEIEFPDTSNCRKDFDDMLDKINRRYSLIEYVDDNAEYNPIIEYINQIDELEKHRGTDNE